MWIPIKTMTINKNQRIEKLSMTSLKKSEKWENAESSCHTQRQTSSQAKFWVLFTSVDEIQKCDHSNKGYWANFHLWCRVQVAYESWSHTKVPIIITISIAPKSKSSKALYKHKHCGAKYMDTEIKWFIYQIKRAIKE